MANVTLTLGRDGMGDEANEVDFEAWVAYVSDRIDEATGLDVAVEIRGARDVQANAVRADGDEAQTVRDALASLWESFCADPGNWPARDEVQS